MDRHLNRREAVAAALLRLAPRLPEFEAGAILDRALASPGLRGAAPETAAWLCLVAYGRHVFTDYDALLDDGYDRDSARHFVLDDLNAALGAWGVRRLISEEETDRETDGEG
ncbi:hypothetical protein ASG60_09185 [Methylobacterium sp. Leaf469]|jgi:hypothetical protein|uniref:DUF2293 domain-containing protein n=1 Tax=unclassified Methylobacterium TaxID=2615210 RepID=UPI0006FDC17A|nr:MULTISPECIES: DUF2293 domain-containing protein [unclassified Methylobacterium]KQP26547.1 hypothetical protein ASF25_07225 [Methylobacterium sp. Leaf100]KQP28251.1 hypothetical protein ASF27_06495 [Methylobacterium sp. Leaf102]KQT89836.1 hypothetical protein ASG60_09185 [Methylobacterium sp. Leaf469]USU34209.1 DUF2293 domain-containing protein [Methylobacterium sp. OTU13CASTA1]